MELQPRPNPNKLTKSNIALKITCFILITLLFISIEIVIFNMYIVQNLEFLKSFNVLIKTTTKNVKTHSIVFVVTTIAVIMISGFITYVLFYKSKKETVKKISDSDENKNIY